MATKQDTYLIDDMTGEVLYDEPGTTVTFMWDGTTYDIDVSESTHKDMQELFGAYVANARKRKRGDKRKTKAAVPESDREDNRLIREAAKAAGIEVSERGRIPNAVKAQFSDA